MNSELRSSKNRNLFLNSVQAEIEAGGELLANWIKKVQYKGGMDSLLGMETWLKGIRSFFNIDHLPLSERERSEIVTRSFAPEFEIIRHAIPVVESFAQKLISPEDSGEVDFEEFIATQMRRERISDFGITQTVKQLTPRDSVSQILDSLNDLRALMDALTRQSAQTYQMYLILGRHFNLELGSCRYVDMLLSQKFRLRHERIENKSISAVLKHISEERVRRNTALVILYLFRFLQYLKPVSNDLKQDRPLKKNLVIFSLLGEEIEYLLDFLRTHFVKDRNVAHSFRSAAELLSHSLKMESHRVMNKELIMVSREAEPAQVYARIENSHGLIRHCCQNGILTIIRSIDKNFDTMDLFPARKERVVAGEKLRKELWSLRQWLMDVLENRKALDTSQIIVQLSSFKESSLHSLMFRDWAEFDAILDALSIESSFIEIRTHLRKFVSFLESLITQLAKRSVSQEKQSFTN
jgi:hypothetical protein